MSDSLKITIGRNEKLNYEIKQYTTTGGWKLRISTEEDDLIIRRKTIEELESFIESMLYNAKEKSIKKSVKEGVK